MAKYVTLLLAWGANFPIAFMYGGVAAFTLFTIAHAALLLGFVGYDAWQFVSDAWL